MARSGGRSLPFDESHSSSSTYVDTSTRRERAHVFSHCASIHHMSKLTFWHRCSINTYRGYWRPASFETSRSKSIDPRSSRSYNATFVSPNQHPPAETLIIPIQNPSFFIIYYYFTSLFKPWPYFLYLNPFLYTYFFSPFFIYMSVSSFFLYVTPFLPLPRIFFPFFPTLIWWFFSSTTLHFFFHHDLIFSTSAYILLHSPCPSHLYLFFHLFIFPLHHSFSFFSMSFLSSLFFNLLIDFHIFHSVFITLTFATNVVSPPVLLPFSTTPSLFHYTFPLKYLATLLAIISTTSLHFLFQHNLIFTPCTLFHSSFLFHLFYFTFPYSHF